MGGLETGGPFLDLAYGASPSWSH